MTARNCHCGHKDYDHGGISGSNPMAMAGLGRLPPCTQCSCATYHRLGAFYGMNQDLCLWCPKRSGEEHRYG